jgi:hypothetical protein
MWSSMKDLVNFNKDYLSYARTGSKTFDAGIWVENDGQNPVKPTQKDLMDPVWKGRHRKLPPTVYSGEKLFAIFLHQVADCSVPINHDPAGQETGCEKTTKAGGFDEGTFELNSRYDNVAAHTLKYDVEVKPGESEATYWNDYCTMFENNMLIHANDMCNHINNTAYPGSESAWISGSCFKDGIYFANMIIVKYLYAVLKKDLSVLPSAPVEIKPPVFPSGGPLFIIDDKIINQARFFGMTLTTTMVVPITIEAFVGMPGDNGRYYYYTIFNGAWSRGNVINTYTLGEIQPLVWPSNEQKRQDGTLGHELEGRVTLHASCTECAEYTATLKVVKDIPVSIKRKYGPATITQNH